MNITTVFGRSGTNYLTIPYLKLTNVQVTQKKLGV